MKIGVGLIAFNKPGYFSHMLKSLEVQTIKDQCEFHLFQDGPRSDSDIDSINHIRGMCETSPLDIDFHGTRYNLGIGRNQFRAYKFLTENYEYCAVVEHDIVLSPHAIALSLNISSQFKDGQIFSVVHTGRRYCGKQEFDEYIGKVREKPLEQDNHNFMMCFYSDVWQEKILPEYMNYYKLIENCEYGERPQADIRALYMQHRFRCNVTSQDAGKSFATFKAGYKNLVPVINRSYYIGQYGEHFRPHIYKRYNFETMKPYSFEKDKDRKSFEFCTQQWP